MSSTLDRKDIIEAMNLQNIASIRIASKIVNDVTPAAGDETEWELRENARVALYRLLKHCEEKP